MRWFLLLGFGLIGLAAVGFGVHWTFRDFVQAEAAQGVVVWQEEERPDPGTVTYYPVVEFRAAGGMLIRFRSALGSPETPRYEQGTQVNVLYDPRRPEKARIGNYGQVWTGPVPALLFGCAILVLSIRLFLKMGRFEKDLRSWTAAGR